MSESTNALWHLAGEITSALGPEGCAYAAALGTAWGMCRSKSLRHAVGKAAWATLKALTKAAWRAVRRLATRPDTGGLKPTAEEKRIMQRLAPHVWKRKAQARQLEGALAGRCKLTPPGIRVNIRVTGTTDLATLLRRESAIRAMLSLRSETRISLTDASRGGWVTLYVHTRSAADSIDPLWNPSCKGIGVDTMTGKVVTIPMDHRLLVAGASGSGKSWSMRPLMAAVQRERNAKLIYLDAKGEEAFIWRKVCRTATDPEQIGGVLGELDREFFRRKAEMDAADASVYRGELIYVVVDEGRELLAGISDDELAVLLRLSSQGRSRRMILVWATQYPTTSGKTPGVHAQIAANTDSKFCLRVKNQTHAQVALDDDADYGPQNIPVDAKGHGYLSGHGATLLRTWKMFDDEVKSLPVDVWRGPEEDSVAVPVSLVPPKAPSAAEEVYEAVVAGLTRQSDIVAKTGRAKGTVSKAVARLVDEGRVTVDSNGEVFPASHPVAA